jgi:hypothetical protein
MVLVVLSPTNIVISVVRYCAARVAFSVARVEFASVGMAEGGEVIEAVRLLSAAVELFKALTVSFANGVAAACAVTIIVVFATFARPVDESEVEVEFKESLELDAATDPRLSDALGWFAAAAAVFEDAEDETTDEVE